MTGVAGPVFVAGLERTGTSLLYALLASHPNIAMTRRTNWWSFFYGRYGDLGDDRNLERCLATMARYRRHRKLEPDFERLRADFVAGPRTYGRLFALLEEQHARRLGRPRWGDKSLNTERYASRVFEDFPDATILHMVRDPRDRYASVVRRWQGGIGGAGTATAAWLESMARGEANARRWPERYLLVRYEDLAARPVEVTEALCRFIGEPFVPSMLEMRGAEAFREGGNSSYGSLPEGTISTASIGRFRSVLTSSDIAFIDGMAGSAMERHSYAREPIAWRPAGRARHAVISWPLNLARLAAWRVRERVYDIVGRDPQAHTIVQGELG
jgi:hypothetical protein